MSRGNPATGNSAGPLQCSETPPPGYCRQPETTGSTGGNANQVILRVKY